MIHHPRKSSPGGYRDPYATVTRGTPDLPWRTLFLGVGILVTQLWLLASRCEAAWVRPLEGSGNFHTMIDVYNHWRADGTLDVVLLFAINNNEVAFQEENGHYRGALKVTAELKSPDGATVYGEKTVVLYAHDRLEAESTTLQQVFPLVLPAVEFRGGVLYCQVDDLKQKRHGLYNTVKKKHMRSEAAGQWVAPDPRRHEDGLTVHDPIFMAHAPAALWDSQHKINLETAAVEFEHVAGMPDNLTNVNGDIWVATHDMTLDQLAECPPTLAQCLIPFTIYNLSGVDLAEQAAYTFDSEAFGAATVAIPHHDKVWLGTFHGDRIASFDQGGVE